MKIDKAKLEMKTLEASTEKLYNEHKEYSDELKTLKDDKEFYNDQFKKFNVYVDASGLTIEQIRYKLQSEDKSLFR